MRRLAGVLTILLPLGATAAAPPATFERPDALLLNLTESDLNRIVMGSFHRNGGPSFAGVKSRAGRGVVDLTYEAELDEPVLRLGENGEAWLDLAVREAKLRIGRLERGIAGRRATCENAGLNVDSAQPLEVMLAFRFRIEDGDVRIVPDRVSVPEANQRMHLVKPSRCIDAPLPRWLLWWVGKPFLRKHVGKLGTILLERARKSAARLEEEGGLVGRRWEFRAEPGEEEELHLFADSLDTRDGSLFVSLTASARGPDAGSAARRGRARHDVRADGSYLAVSEALANEVARLSVTRLSTEPDRPAGNLRKLLESSSAYALIPGLRDRPARREGLLYSVSFGSAPRVEFAGRPGTKGSAPDAVIRVTFSDVALHLWRDDPQGPSRLGTLEVDEGRVAVAPFTSVLGGISFEIVENEWTVSSVGIEFNDNLVAATLQELTFGRIFETTYEPLASSAFHVGDTVFVPGAFEAQRGYLVIELEAPETPPGQDAAEAPTRTDTLLGSR